MEVRKWPGCTHSCVHLHEGSWRLGEIGQLDPRTRRRSLGTWEWSRPASLVALAQLLQGKARLCPRLCCKNTVEGSRAGSIQLHSVGRTLLGLESSHLAPQFLVGTRTDTHRALPEMAARKLTVPQLP